jgi:hypothetical protein
VTNSLVYGTAITVGVKFYRCRNYLACTEMLFLINSVVKLKNKP